MSGPSHRRWVTQREQVHPDARIQRAGGTEHPGHLVQPVHAMTTASIEHMERQSGENFAVQRFRPNFLVQTDPGCTGLPEFDWIGKKLKIGDCLFGVEAKTIRCSMPSRGQLPHGLEQNPKIAKSLFSETGRFLGAYLSVLEVGKVCVGDSVIVVD